MTVRTGQIYWAGQSVSGSFLFLFFSSDIRLGYKDCFSVVVLTGLMFVRDYFSVI